MLKNFIFDLDGTLINSSNEVLLCLKKSFIKADCPFYENKLSSDIIGPPLKEIIKSVCHNDIDDKILEKVMFNFRDIYDNEPDDISELYDGVIDLLYDLKKSDNKLFIATFKPNKPTTRILSQFKLSIFDDVYTIDKFNKIMNKAEMIKDILCKYSLKSDETVMIGDALSDVQAAKSADVLSIGVLWGYCKNKEDLIKNADFTVNNIEELKRCLKLNYQTI